MQVVVLCFAVFLGSWSPLSSTGINLPSLSASSSKGAVDYSTPSGKKKIPSSSKRNVNTIMQQ